jgi:hypothetical protein
MILFCTSFFGSLGKEVKIKNSRIFSTCMAQKKPTTDPCFSTRYLWNCVTNVDVVHKMRAKFITRIKIRPSLVQGMVFI